jgi:putative membrane-bound dehydrogenase-like protein
MRTNLPPFLFLTVLASAPAQSWQTTLLETDFYAEGAAHGDINGDGATDIAYGPFWFQGPAYTAKHRFAQGDSFNGRRGYSDNFFSYITDADKDGKNDILVYGFPGKEARLYLNPGAGSTDPWKMHIVAPEVSNESPTFADIIPGGLPEIVCSHDNQYGYYQAGKDATQPWQWHAISGNEAGGRFEHGLGVGDVNGDGHMDILQRTFWYEHPATPSDDAPWEKHRWATRPLPGGAQILVHDLDGDGDSDIISSLAAHGYGLCWWEQDTPGHFLPHDLMGDSSTDNPYGVCFSQLHALALADIDGDGRMDFVTGKRHFAHQGHDAGGLGEPVVYWFRNTKSGKSVEFVPHLVHRDSGVGVELKVADLNGDGRLDIISSNKKGLSIHIQNGDVHATALAPWKVDGRSQENYGRGLSAQEAVKKMEVPEGFSVDLIAAEPDITQPIAMCFDAKGRIWVVEGHTYPIPAPEGQGKDRILIFEDADGNGSFETRKVFAEGINLASGIEVGFGGVFVGAAPYLLFFPDKDGDDKPDSSPEILLDGWGQQDTHETLNSFTWGPDGWLYGCHGVFTHSIVGKPGTPEDQRTKLNAGVWRFHPVTREFEVFAHGTSNPWGVDFNEYGDFFVSACVIPHFFHLSQGGRYKRQAGQHFNPYTFEDIQTIADHAHYTGNIRDHAFWGSKPIAPPDTSALGGGHAHCGLAFYLADTFPEPFRGHAYFHNLHGHRMVREQLDHNGSGYIARHRPDFVLSNNHDFIGVGVMLGPDGALYYADWVDPQTCHHRDANIWNRTNGRIYRVRYGAQQSTKLALKEQSDAQLVQTLANPNAFLARQAQRLLQERKASSKLDTQATDAALTKFESTQPSDTPLRLRALWARHVTGLLLPQHFKSLLQDSDEHIRAWAVQLLGEGKQALPGDVLQQLETMAAQEDSLVVRRYLASKLQRLPADQCWKIAEGLASHSLSGHDANLPLLCWYGIEPLIEEDAQRALALVEKAAWPQLKDFITRRAAVTPDGRSAIMASLAKANKPDTFVSRSQQLLQSLAGLPPVEHPAGWEKARAQGESLAANAPAVQDVLNKLGARFGDPDFFPEWRKRVLDTNAQPAARAEALQMLTIGNDPEIAPIARQSLQFPFLRKPAIDALKRHPGQETASALVSQLGNFQVQLRNEAINLLATRPDMALELLTAVDRGQLQASLVSPVLLNHFERFKDDKINSLIQRNWIRGGSGIDPAQLNKSIAEWKQKLNDRTLSRANASRGRETFTKTCGICHQLFGEGVALGPDLTGSNRADLGYLLENVLSPSSVVGKDYLLQVLKMKDGTTLSGIIRKESPEFIEIAMPGGSSNQVKVAEIQTREEIAQSLMPPALFDTLPASQVADLVKYLASPGQVPLPGQGAPQANSDVPPPEKGVLRIEGENLLAKARHKSGNLVAQNMRGFGTSWSGNQHLWWTGAKPGDLLTLELPAQQPGTYSLALFPTTARDYATIEVTILGKTLTSDLYTEKVLPGTPLHFKNLCLPNTQPLQIEIKITGKNPAAAPAHMFGLDRIELTPSK